MNKRSRGNEEPLSAGRIARAAIALVDEAGFEALSMRKLASQLGIEAMSLYHHVSSKAALLDAMVDEMARSLSPVGTEAGWRGSLSAAAAEWLGLARRHPGAFPLVATRSQARPALLDWYAGIYGALSAAGFGPVAVARVATSFFVSLSGFLLAAGRPVLFPEVPEPSGETLTGLSPRSMELLSQVPAEAWDISTDAAYRAHVVFLLEGAAAVLEKESRPGTRRRMARRK